MAIFVFLVILILFFGILSSMSNPERGEELSKNAELITKALTGESSNSIVEENKLDKDKLLSLNYDELKKELGVTGDFCIYFEDSAGNLIPILKDDQGDDDPANDLYVNGIGSGVIKINGQECEAEYQIPPAAGP